MRHLIKIIAICTSSVIYSQEIELPKEYITNTIFKNQNHGDFKEIMGTKYLDEKFNTGVISFNDKKISGLLRYNMLNDVFELMNPTSNEITTLSRLEDLKSKHWIF